MQFLSVAFNKPKKAGPIENLNRKLDRNGNTICLLTYKHLESCDYAIQIFHGIHLYGQPMRVQFSQNSTNNNNNNNMNRESSSSNLNSRLSNSDLSSTSDRGKNFGSGFNQSHHNTNSSSSSSLMQTGLISQLMMASPILPLVGNSNPFLPTSCMQPNPAFNRSRSGSHLHDYDNPHHQASGNYNNNPTGSAGKYDRQHSGNNFRGMSNDHQRGHNHSHHHHHHHHQNRDRHDNGNRQYDNSRERKDHRSRSRSPINNNHNNGGNNMYSKRHRR
jgi:RNA recognition motif-containing protein